MYILYIIRGLWKYYYNSQKIRKNLNTHKKDSVHHSYAIKIYDIDIFIYVKRHLQNMKLKKQLLRTICSGITF